MKNSALYLRQIKIRRLSFKKRTISVTVARGVSLPEDSHCSLHSAHYKIKTLPGVGEAGMSYRLINMMLNICSLLISSLLLNNNLFYMYLSTYIHIHPSNRSCKNIFWHPKQNTNLSMYTKVMYRFTLLVFCQYICAYMYISTKK